MKNFMAVMGAVALLALPVVLVTAPASVSAEEALAETGFEEVYGFSVLSRVTADLLSRQELNDIIGRVLPPPPPDQEFTIELNFVRGFAADHLAVDGEFTGCGSDGCEIEIGGGEAAADESGRTSFLFSLVALQSMCGCTLGPDQAVFLDPIGDPGRPSLDPGG